MPELLLIGIGEEPQLPLDEVEIKVVDVEEFEANDDDASVDGVVL